MIRNIKTTMQEVKTTLTQLQNLATKIQDAIQSSPETGPDRIQIQHNQERLEQICSRISEIRTQLAA